LNSNEKMTTDAKFFRRCARTSTACRANLAAQLGVTRAAIFGGRIEDLRQLGYESSGSAISARLVGVPDVFTGRFARAPRQKRSHRTRHPRVRADDLDDDVIEKLARDGERGCGLFSPSRKRKAGAVGRKWISPERKGLWFSIFAAADLRHAERPN